MRPVFCARCGRECPVGSPYAHLNGVPEHIVCPQDDRYRDQPIIPDPEHEWTAYGVSLSSVGEDGAYLASGHVEPLRMIAAMRKANRDHLGLLDSEVFGDCSPTLAPLTDQIRHRRAVFTEDDDGEYPWYVHWGEDAQHHAAALDVTVYEP